MTVVQRGQSFQATVYYSKIKPGRWRRQFPTEIEAKRWELDSTEALQAGRLPDMGEGSNTLGHSFRPTTVGDLMEYKCRHHWGNMKGGKSACANARHMAKILGPETPLGKVDKIAIDLAVEELRKQGYPESTINKKLSTVRFAFDEAVKDGWLAKAPSVPFFKQGEGRMKVFTPAEERAQLDWCRATGDMELEDYIVTSYDLGWRQAEALTCKPRNLETDTYVVTLWGQTTDVDNGTKAGNTRRIPPTPRVRAILESRAEGRGPNAPIFDMDQDELQRRWGRMRTALGFALDPEWVPHAMRHTFCSRLVNDHNVNVAVVQKLAGHLRIETTLKYVHVDERAMEKAIAALAGQRNSVYSPTPQSNPAAPHATVASHITQVADTIDQETAANGMELQGKAA